MSVLLAQGYKHMPDKVTDPLHQLLNWFLWAALVICLVWLIRAGGRFGTAYFAGNSDGIDLASSGVFWSLIGAITASSAVSIALAVLN